MAGSFSITVLTGLLFVSDDRYLAQLCSAADRMGDGLEHSLSRAYVYQERNEHHLMRDFEDEVPGYLHNRKIADSLNSLSLRSGAENISSNLLSCYEELVRKGIFVQKELMLLQAWLNDVEAAG